MDNSGLDAFLKDFIGDEPVLSPEEVEKEKEILGKFTDGELLVIDDLAARLPAKKHIIREIDNIRKELSDDTKLRVSVQDDRIEFILDENECVELYMELILHPKMGIILNMHIYPTGGDIVDPYSCLNCGWGLVLEKIIEHITDVNAFGYEIHYDICTYRCSNCGSLHQGHDYDGYIGNLELIPEEKKEKNDFNQNPFTSDPSVPFNSEPFTSEPFVAPPFSIESANFPTWEELEKKRKDLIYFVNISGDEQIASLLRAAYTELHLTVWGEDAAEKALKDIYSHLMTLKRAGVKKDKKLKQAKDDRVHTLFTSRISELEYRIKELERELTEFKTKSNWDAFGL